jgi:hypothetical protein
MLVRGITYIPEEKNTYSCELHMCSTNDFLRCLWSMEVVAIFTTCRHDQPTPFSPKLSPARRQRF